MPCTALWISADFFCQEIDLLLAQKIVVQWDILYFTTNDLLLVWSVCLWRRCVWDLIAANWKGKKKALGKFSARNSTCFLKERLCHWERGSSGKHGEEQHPPRPLADAHIVSVWQCWVPNGGTAGKVAGYCCWMHVRHLRGFAGVNQ